MEDVKIGRASPGSSGSAVIDNANANLLLQGNQRRVAIVISPPNGQRVTLGFGRKPVLDDGLTLPASSTPIVLDIKDVGQVICLPIYGIVSGGAPLNVGFIEAVLDEKGL